MVEIFFSIYKGINGLYVNWNDKILNSQNQRYFLKKYTDWLDSNNIEYYYALSITLHTNKVFSSDPMSPYYYIDGVLLYMSLEDLILFKLMFSEEKFNIIVKEI